MKPDPHFEGRKTAWSTVFLFLFGLLCVCYMVYTGYEVHKLKCEQGRLETIIKEAGLSPNGNERLIVIPAEAEESIKEPSRPAFLRSKREIIGSSNNPGTLNSLMSAMGCLQCGPSAPGRDGRDGAQGLPGPEGRQGPIGPMGPPGSNGAHGQTGPSGKDGSPGDPGSPGMTGPQGVQGVTGPQGGQGEQGVKGEKGETGLQGPIGPKGAAAQMPSPGALKALVESFVSARLSVVGRDVTTYTRWGRLYCPHGTSTVYKGAMGGPYYNKNGNGANYLCLPENPKYKKTNSVSTDQVIYGWIYAATYQFSSYKNGASSPISSRLHDRDVPCSVCETGGHTSLMIPATIDCPAGWRKEYEGYIMTQGPEGHRTEYICMDADAEPGWNNSGGQQGAYLFHVSAECDGATQGGLGFCGKSGYQKRRELACVVCSK